MAGLPTRWALSVVSPGKGRILKPEIKWEYYLGAPRVAIATDRDSGPPNTVDLYGDRLVEVLAGGGDGILRVIGNAASP